MTDPVVKPLDPVYCTRDFPGREAEKKRKKLESDLEYNAERRKRIVKCWDCGHFGYCYDPANCRKEKPK